MTAPYFRARAPLKHNANTSSFILFLDDQVPEQVMAAITYQIIWGLCYLHHDHNIHRDLKPGNVVMNSRGEVKLSDFGIFRSLETTIATSETFTGTYKFMSPERLEGKSYNEAADIWSLGVMVLQLWTKKYPFKGGEYSPLELIDVLENTDVRAFAPADVVPPAMAESVISMLAFEPEHRSTAVQLMKCEWMEQNKIFGLDEAQAIVADWVASAYPDIKLESIMSPTGTSTSSESKRTLDDDDDTEDAKGHGGVDDDCKNDRDVKRRGSGSGALRKNYAEAKFSDDEEDERDDTHGRK